MKEILDRLDALEKKLEEQSFLTKPVFNTKEAAKFLGVSTSHLYKLVSECKIPSHHPKNSDKVYFLKKELEEWVIGNFVFASILGLIYNPIM